MFDGFKKIWKGIMRMFGYTTLKNIVGTDITLSQEMIDAINEWKNMIYGNAEWINDSVESLKIEEGICREFADAVLVELDTSIDNDKLNVAYQKSIRNLNEEFQE